MVKNNIKEVIYGLECCAASCKDGCPYWDIENGCMSVLSSDAAELLKQFVPIKPIKCNKSFTHTDPIEFEYKCFICGTGLMKHWVACPNCGSMVKWCK